MPLPEGGEGGEGDGLSDGLAEVGLGFDDDGAGFGPGVDCDGLGDEVCGFDDGQGALVGWLDGEGEDVCGFFVFGFLVHRGFVVVGVTGDDVDGLFDGDDDGLRVDGATVGLPEEGVGLLDDGVGLPDEGVGLLVDGELEVGAGDPLSSG